MQHSTHKPRSTDFSQTLLGAHCSIAGGLENALLEGAALGCTCIQMFTHSNRQWNIKPLDDESVQRFNQARNATGIDQIAVHSSYLINIGSPKKNVAHVSVHTLRQELERCEQLKIPYLIMHPGAALQDSPEECIKRIADALASVCTEVPYKYTKILLENMAGQGSVIGSTLEQLAEIKKLVVHHKQRIGFCIDLCHAFTAGYNFLTPETYEAFWSECDKMLGLHSIHALHMNDSQKTLGSHVDRHAHIGKGHMGILPFEMIMNDPRFIEVLKILETPLDSHGNHASNLAELRSLIKNF
jgi:deoxyribonuclease-4